MIKIRKATTEQCHLIRKMAYTIWPYSYKNMISHQQITYMLNLMYSEEALKSQMALGHTFLITWQNENALGFASFETGYEGKKETRLHKLYIMPETQGKGVGRILLSEVLKQAGAGADEKLSLTVNRTNKAVEFYKKIGFTITESVDKPIGNGFLMEDYIMKKDL